ncbi:condensation domain-containing protein, partial [Inquilinus sp. 2KB_12]|uniref:condensation domain-containing protein n=1 Tax=Inquilinus sp. 2KB_12 TaxID=3232975 RepID=UPI003F9357B7
MAGVIEDILPLTPLQEGLLFHGLYDEEGPDAYLVQMTFDLAGRLDAPLLGRSARKLLARHANLRAAFRHGGLERPVQVILRAAEPSWTELDLSGLGE